MTTARDLHADYRAERRRVRAALCSITNLSYAGPLTPYLGRTPRRYRDYANALSALSMLRSLLIESSARRPQIIAAADSIAALRDSTSAGTRALAVAAEHEAARWRSHSALVEIAPITLGVAVGLDPDAELTLQIADVARHVAICACETHGRDALPPMPMLPMLLPITGTCVRSRMRIYDLVRGRGRPPSIERQATAVTAAVLGESYEAVERRLQRMGERRIYTPEGTVPIAMLLGRAVSRALSSRAPRARRARVVRAATAAN